MERPQMETPQLWDSGKTKQSVESVESVEAMESVYTDDDSIAKEAKASAKQNWMKTCENKQSCICNEEERRTSKK